MPTATSRPELMTRIRQRGSGPELILRSALHKNGLRFRICTTELPGRPDIVFPKQKLRFLFMDVSGTLITARLRSRLPLELSFGSRN